PIRELEKLYAGGLQIPQTVYLLDVTGAMSDPMGRGFEDGDPDGHAHPIAGTLVSVPWTEPPRAQVLMTLAEGGHPAMVEPRNILRHVLTRFAPLGLKPVVAFELEFYLIDRKRGPGREPLVAADPVGETPAVGNVYEIRELDRFSRVLEAIEAAALAQGVP